MSVAAPQRVLLTSYLILFLNFGPSFHRAPIFGLHDHNHVQTECSCCQTHGIEKSKHNLTGYIEQQPCDCRLCKFFDIYSALQINDSVEFETEVHPTTISFELPSELTAIVAYPARGPPVI